MKPKHCCDCAYWGGESVGFWTALPNNMNWAAKDEKKKDINFLIHNDHYQKGKGKTK